MLLNDKRIKELVQKENLIDPFIPTQIEEEVISYGLGSYGYDIRIGNRFFEFSYGDSGKVDPKSFDDTTVKKKETEESILVPPNSFALGYSQEALSMPSDVMGICVGKSTYARSGIIVNITPVEPGWRGHLTIEISNTTPLPAEIYSGEGIAQILFFQSEKPETTYADRSGKYQNQKADVYTSKIKRR